jgi:DNA-directed RNA polymerase subunit beta
VGDILCSLSYFLNLNDGIGEVDEVDNLGNKLVKTVGDLLQAQFRTGTSRIVKNVREKLLLTIKESLLKLNLLINSKPLSSVISEFFNLSQLCQLLDQTNSLAEMSNKRRITALGPGGLSKEQAGLDIRDISDSDFCRVCPVETPEGPNIGLVKNLSVNARINENGFIEAPYRKVVNGVVTSEITYLSATEERYYCIGQAGITLDTHGKILNDQVIARFQDETTLIPVKQLDFVLVSPSQVFSIATGCIPFLEFDDANRALMGANMQRQAVPLLNPESPIIATGLEADIAKYSGSALVAPADGTIEYVDSEKIVFVDNRNRKTTYSLTSFQRSNQNTVVLQTPLVNSGDVVTSGQILADGSAMQKGELALGKDVLVAFMT